MRARKIKSISGLITNSSTECFILKGSAAQLGLFWKKYAKYFLYLKDISEVKEFIKSPKDFNKNYSKYMLYNLAQNELSLLDDILGVTKKPFDEVWSFLEECLKEKLDGGIVLYMDYRNNNKIISGISKLFPGRSGNNYKWVTV